MSQYVFSVHYCYTSCLTYLYPFVKMDGVLVEGWTIEYNLEQILQKQSVDFILKSFHNSVWRISGEPRSMPEPILYYHNYGKRTI